MTLLYLSQEKEISPECVPPEINSYSAHTYVAEQECSIQSMLQLIQLDTLCYVAEEISITLQICRTDALLSTVSLIQ